MRRMFNIFFLTAIAVTAVQAQVDIRDVDVVRSGGSLDVSFTAHISKKAAPGKLTLIYAPQVTNGEHVVSLPVSIMVQGRRAGILWERHAWAAGIDVPSGGFIQARRGGTVTYRVSVPYQDWMSDSFLSAELIEACCGSVSRSELPMAGVVLPVESPVHVDVDEDPAFAEEHQPMTEGERIAEAFPFVLDASEFNPKNPISLYDDERDNSLIVYYRINSSKIESGYSGNHQTLINLLSSIEVIEGSGDSRVKYVVVAGFSSPEGPFELNDRLAWERAVAVKEYIMKNSDVAGDDILLYNGSADWQGLRLLVDGDRNMPDREKVLDMIDNRPIWDPTSQVGRTTLLRQLNGGTAYRYMTENMFPLLRNGAFIRVYFENKP